MDGYRRRRHRSLTFDLDGSGAFARVEELGDFERQPGESAPGSFVYTGLAEDDSSLLRVTSTDLHDPVLEARGDSVAMVIHGVLGQARSDCADLGRGHHEAVDVTGGASLNLCDAHGPDDFRVILETSWSR